MRGAAAVRALRPLWPARSAALVKRFIPRVNPALGFPPVENPVEKVKNPVFWRGFFHMLPVFHRVFNALWKTQSLNKGLMRVFVKGIQPNFFVKNRRPRRKKRRVGGAGQNARGSVHFKGFWGLRPKAGPEPRKSMAAEGPRLESPLSRPGRWMPAWFSRARACFRLDFAGRVRYTYIIKGSRGPGAGAGRTGQRGAEPFAI